MFISRWPTPCIFSFLSEHHRADAAGGFWRRENGVKAIAAVYFQDHRFGGLKGLRSGLKGLGSGLIGLILGPRILALTISSSFVSDATFLSETGRGILAALQPVEECSPSLKPGATSQSSAPMESPWSRIRFSTVSSTEALWNGARMDRPPGMFIYFLGVSEAMSLFKSTKDQSPNQRSSCSVLPPSLLTAILTRSELCDGV